MDTNKNQPIKYFLDNIWPKYRSQLYRDLYNTYHPSTYTESFNRPSSNFEDALETLADAVHEGKKLGLLDSSVDWSDIVHYDDYDYSTSDLRLIDDNGIPTLNNKLEIMDNTNLDWIHGILLFDVLEDIVEEFRCYCGENGVDPNCEGKCMDEFPPTPVEGTNKPENSGTLKQDYYTLFNFMRELERADIPVSEYMKSPLFPKIIKLVDDGTTDYNEEGGERNSEDWDNTRTQIEFEMDAPDRIYEQDKYPTGDQMSNLERTMKDLNFQLKMVGTFGFGISGMFGMAKDLLEGRYPVLTETDITLIFLAAMVYMGVDVVSDVKKVFEMVNDRGLKEYISQTVETLTDFKNIAIKVGEKVGFAISSLTELLGYTILLTPILDATTKLINEESLDIVTLGMYLKSALLSVGIFYVRNVFNGIIKRLRRVNDREDNEEIIEEAYINGKRVYDKYSNNKLITEEIVGELSLLDPSPINKNLDWIVNEGLKINFINNSVSETLNKFNNHTNLIASTNNSKIRKYPSIVEMDILLNKLVKEDKAHENIYMSKIADKATTDVVKDIFEVITLFEDGEEYFILPDYYTDKDGDEYRYSDLEFNVEVNIVDESQYTITQDETFVIDAAMGGDNDDTIYVDIVLSSNFSEKDYESLQIVLSEYIRHEIEHLLQIIDPNRPDIINKDEEMSPFEYYTQPHEIEAQKVGFERRAKMEERPLEDVINDYIEYRQAIDKLTPKEKHMLVSKLT